jgi:hypothetical protein
MNHRFRPDVGALSSFVHGGARQHLCGSDQLSHPQDALGAPDVAPEA